MSEEEAIAALNAMAAEGGYPDPEADHSAAEEILLAMVSDEVRDAYRALVKRSLWWATS